MRAIIVDDELLARARLRRLLGAHADVEVLAECGDGRAALESVRSQRPDVMFLDIHMPELDGFAMLAALGELTAAIVFVTAYERHAARAFDANAVDYLVKPFDAARLARALDRVRKREPAIVPVSRPARLPVRSGDRIELIDIDAIDYLVADGNYVAIHAGGRDHLVRETLSAMARRLDPAQFVRIHRSRIVRLDRIRAVEPLFHGEYRLTLRDGTYLTSARGYRDTLRLALHL